MPSLSPSPAKRPPITQRTSSANSLSSSGKNTTLKPHRPHGPHVVVRGHSRNASHGKNLSKLGRNNSSTNVLAEAGRTHQRKKSGNSSPPSSPRLPPVKRNSSHVVLTKNNSHTNLRKNHSAVALARNVSHPTLKKVGLAPPAIKTTELEDQKQDVFKLGDQSSDEEGAEWEDSATLSPEITRNNSKTSTPARVSTPQPQEPVLQKPPDVRIPHSEKTSSPPAASLHNNNRSAPNLANQPAVARLRPFEGGHHAPNPVLLASPRASRAPPAMSTISAIVPPHPLSRTDSSKSFTHITHADVDSPSAPPGQFGSGGGASSSADGGVSHFLTGTTPSTTRLSADDGSDYDSTNFMANYHPLPSQSPENNRITNKVSLPHVPSRTQQKLELQRRETMRAGAPAPSAPPGASMPFTLGSSTSLHSRSGSRGRNRVVTGEVKALKREFEMATKQLGVVRRFRSPIIESLNRLKDAGVLPQETGVITPASAGMKSRPQSRRGFSGATANGNVKTGLSRSLEDKKPSPMVSRSNSRGRGGGRVQIHRQGSHDDIALSRSKGSDEGDEDGEGGDRDGMSKEEAMIRRIWESREVYDHSTMTGDGEEAT